MMTNEARGLEMVGGLGVLEGTANERAMHSQTTDVLSVALLANLHAPPRTDESKTSQVTLQMLDFA